jgi:putative peptide zinc metalloprotease protein
MSGVFLSPDWYRVADLRLRRRTHVQMARHVYRGQPWYVIQDLQGGKFHRITEQSHALFARMDGTRTVQDIWETVCQLFPDAPPSQTEMLQLLSQLHNADLVSADRRPNLHEIDRRAREEARKTAMGYFKNPMSIRVPLFDPEPLLRPLRPLAMALFSVTGAIGWLLLILAAAITAFVSRDRLDAPTAESILTAANITYMAVAYLVVKLLHELGHGLAVKRWGGEVREVGIMLLVFFPVPYVDASQATFFPSKYQRMVVSGAGIMVELALASIALIVWAMAEEGALATLAYNIFLIGGVSTLLFNGNPLLRFDGYFVFADWIESPNLGQRSNQYFWHIFQRIVLGQDDPRRPPVGPKERPWLLGYAVAAFVYRMVVMVLISLYVASAVPFFGFAIVLLSLYFVFIVPAAKGIRYMATDPGLDVNRSMATLRLAGLAAVVAGIVWLVPMPHATVADAVLEMPAETMVRTQASGVVEQLIARNGDEVRKGDPILRLSEPFLELETALALAELDDARMRLEVVPITDSNARALWAEQVAFRTALHQELLRRAADLLVRAPVSGQLVLPDQHRMVGSLMRQGDILGSVLRPGEERWRTAVPADRAKYVDEDIRSIELRINMYPSEVLEVRIQSRSPEVTTRLSSFGLTNRAGGRLVGDPSQDTPTSVEPVVAYLLTASGPALIAHLGLLPVGSRAEVRFQHSPMPLAPRIWRTIRLTFLTYFRT